MSALLPLAAIAALMLLTSKKAGAAAPSAPRGIVTPGEPYLVKTAPKPAPKASDALQAAMLAEKQLGKPKTAATVEKNAGVAQVVPGGALPPGYSRTQATVKAQPTTDHIRTRKGKYDRALLMSFQTSAGLRADGMYGPQTAAALRHFGAKNVPAALFKGSATKYTPPAGG